MTTTATTTDALNATLATYGIEPTLADHTGTTIAQAWAAAFGILDTPAPPDVEDVVYAELGTTAQPRPRRGYRSTSLRLVWRTPNPQPDEDDDPDLLAEDHDWVSATQFPEHWDDPEVGLFAEVGDVYLTVPKTDAIRAAVLAEPQRRERAQARSLLDQIVTGKKAPWELLEANPTTTNLLDHAATQANVKVGDVPSLKIGRVRWNGTASAALANINAAIAYLSGATTTEPTPSKDAWHHSGLDHATKWLTDARKYQASLDPYLRTQEDIDAGRLPEHVVQVLSDPKVESHKAWLARQAKGYGEHALQELHKLRTDQATLGAYVDAVTVRDRAARTVRDLSWALCWPGDPDTCPPKPSTYQPSGDPWSDLDLGAGVPAF